MLPLSSVLSLTRCPLVLGVFGRRASWTFGDGVASAVDGSRLAGDDEGGDRGRLVLVQEGDVVILPAFGASYEEMEMLDKKVRYKIRGFIYVFE